MGDAEVGLTAAEMSRLRLRELTEPPVDDQRCSICYCEFVQGDKLLSLQAPAVRGVTGAMGAMGGYGLRVMGSSEARGAGGHGVMGGTGALVAVVTPDRQAATTSTRKAIVTSPLLPLRPVTAVTPRYCRYSPLLP